MITLYGGAPQGEFGKAGNELFRVMTSFAPVQYVLIHTLMDFDQTIYVIKDEALNPESLHGAIENANMTEAQSDLLERIEAAGRNEEDETVEILRTGGTFELPIGAKITTSFGLY